jgi:hypothetical protein
MIGRRRGHSQKQKSPPTRTEVPRKPDQSGAVLAQRRSGFVDRATPPAYNNDMPRPGFSWRHIVISTHRSWLPGDKRGFRSRKHRIHSSGDYKNPPPLSEHAGLRKHNQNDAPAIEIVKALRPVIGRSIVQTLQEMNLQVVAVAVSHKHAHALAQMPVGEKVQNRIRGECKRISSRAVKAQLPGKVWGDGGKLKEVKTKWHLHKAARYIVLEQERGTWTWNPQTGEAWMR